MTGQSCPGGKTASGPTAKIERPWSWIVPWRFQSLEAMVHDGLEQYTAFTDGIKIGRYGEMVGGEVDGDAYQCALRKRKEIDWCLATLDRVLQRQLLHAYYCGGLSLHHRGWAETARRVRVQGVQPPRICPGPVRCRVPGDDRYHLQTCDVGKTCQWDHDTFERQLWLAHEALWRTHEKRYSKADDS